MSDLCVAYTTITLVFFSVLFISIIIIHLHLRKSELQNKPWKVMKCVCVCVWTGGFGGRVIILDSAQAMTGKFKCIFLAGKGNNRILNGFTVYIKMEMKMLPVFASTRRFLRQQIANESWPYFTLIHYISYFSCFSLFFFNPPFYPPSSLRLPFETEHAGNPFWTHKWYIKGSAE